MIDCVSGQDGHIIISHVAMFAGTLSLNVWEIARRYPLTNQKTVRALNYTVARKPALQRSVISSPPQNNLKSHLSVVLKGSLSFPFVRSANVPKIVTHHLMAFMQRGI